METTKRWSKPEPAREIFGQSAADYLFHAQLGDTTIVFYGDRTFTHDGDAISGRSEGDWFERDGKLWFYEDSVPDGVDAAVEEIQAAYSQWQSKLARCVLQEITK